MSLSTVSATIQDPSGQVFANGTWQLIFKPTYGTPGLFTDGGVPFNTLLGGSLDSTGSFSQAINRNDTISPAGSHWTLLVTPNASGQAYSVDLNVNSPVFNASSFINAVITNIQVSATPISLAYKDSELVPTPKDGSTYFDTTLNVMKVWDATNGVWLVLTPNNGNPTFNNVLVKTLEGVRFADQFATLNAAIADLSGGGIVYLSPNTTYSVTSTIPVTSAGVVVKGAGFTSTISVNHTADVFQVSAALFRLEDCEVSISSTSTRSGSAVINANNASAQQGCVRNVRFTGNGTTPNNGSVFITSTPGVGIWQFDKIRIPGGVTWNSLASLTSATATTVASFQFSNVVGSAKYFDGGIVLDGSIDTVQMVNFDITSSLAGSGPMLWLRNTVAAPINPRWVHCSNFAVECQGGTAITLDACRDFKYIGGYVATCTTGVAIGANALMTTVADSLFTNIGGSAITVNAAALHTLIHHNNFEDTCNSVDNTFDTISVAANTADIEVSFNAFRTIGANKPAHFVNLSGTTDSYFVIGNDFKGTASTGAITNTASGSNRIVWGNMPDASISNSVNNASVFNGAVTWNGSPLFNIKPISGGGVGYQFNGATSGSTSIVPTAIAGSTTQTLQAQTGTILLQVGATSQKSESAADTNVLTVTPAASAGKYRVSFSLDVSAAASAVLGWTITYKDSNGAAVAPTNLALSQLGTAAPALTFTTSAASNYSGSVDITIDNSSTNILVKFTLASGTITAKASATIERVI